MGCFSFKCLECGRGVLSSSFSGEPVHLFLLKKGKVLQQMTGEYNSYGAVFIDKTQREGVKHDLRNSVEWNDPSPDDSGRDPWHKICDLMHDKEDFTGGIAAVHVACYKGELPTIRSPRDPNQGWGDEDDESSYFGTTQGEGHEYPRRKPVEGFDARKELRKEQIEEQLGSLHRDITFLAICVSSRETLKDNKIELSDRVMKKILEADTKNLDAKKKIFEALKKEYLTVGGKAEDLEYYA
jgi:hypothetical protein